MPMFRTTIFFEQGAYGWSEAFHNLASDFTTLYNRTLTLLNARKEGIPESARISYVRNSDDLVFRDSQIIDIGGNGIIGTQFSLVNPSDPTFSSVLVRLAASPTIRRLWYCRPSLLGEGTDGSRAVDLPFQLDFMNVMRNVLTDPAQGWAVKHLNPSTGEVPVIAWSNPDGFLALSTDAPLGAAVGSQVRIRNAKVPGVLGTTFTVKGISDAGLTTSLNYAMPTLGPVSQPGFVRPLNYTLAQITTLTPERIVSRRTGRPFDSPRGRR